VEKGIYRQLAEEAEQYAEINKSEITKHDTGNQKYGWDAKRRKKT
jgi:hypothetical protein